MRAAAQHHTTKHATMPVNNARLDLLMHPSAPALWAHEKGVPGLGRLNQLTILWKFVALGEAASGPASEAVAEDLAELWGPHGRSLLPTLLATLPAGSANLEDSAASEAADAEVADDKRSASGNWPLARLCR